MTSDLVSLRFLTLQKIRRPARHRPYHEKRRFHPLRLQNIQKPTRRRRRRAIIKRQRNQLLFPGHRHRHRRIRRCCWLFRLDRLLFRFFLWFHRSLLVRSICRLFLHLLPRLFPFRLIRRHLIPARTASRLPDRIPDQFPHSKSPETNPNHYRHQHHELQPRIIHIHPM